MNPLIEVDMVTTNIPEDVHIRVYHGYGHMQNLVLYGHVLRGPAPTGVPYPHSSWGNIRRLLGLFAVRPVPGARVQLQWNDQLIEAETESDGFFKLEWASTLPTPAGWHEATVTLFRSNISAKGKLFVPHLAQYAIISDIDDTVLVSHSARLFRRLRELLTKNPATRRAYPAVVRHYQALAQAHNITNVPNPFFYVSSSEWNLYPDLVAFFAIQELPEGVFLLNQLKRWYHFFRSGGTGHQGKLLRITRILEAFPHQRFVLFGDNSQADPSIYSLLAQHHPKQIAAVYIRDIRPSRTNATRQLLSQLSQLGIPVCLYRNSQEALQHSRDTGLLL